MSADGIVNLHTKIGSLYPTPPFDFHKTLEFLDFFKPMQKEQTLSDHELLKGISINGQAIVCQVRSIGSVEKPELDYILYSAQSISALAKLAVEDRISFFLSLEDDLRPFYQIAQQDSHFAPIIQQLYGYHQVKFLTPFESACWAILSQRNPTAMALKMKEALVQKYGSSLQVKGITHWIFPEPEQMAVADASELAKVVRNERKGEQLSGVVRAFNGVDEQFLRTAPYEEVAEWLHAIKGIGEWSASFILLRGLGRMEQVPQGEKKLLEAASRLYGNGQSLTDRDIQRLGEPYGQWRGYWAHYVRVAS